jgi:uncharacterized membrane protein YvbJ
MFCANCGTKQNEGEKFCPNCGTKFEMTLSSNNNINEDKYVQIWENIETNQNAIPFCEQKKKNESGLISDKIEKRHL